MLNGAAQDRAILRARDYKPLFPRHPLSQIYPSLVDTHPLFSADSSFFVFLIRNFVTSSSLFLPPSPFRFSLSLFFSFFVFLTCFAEKFNPLSSLLAIHFHFGNPPAVISFGFYRCLLFSSTTLLFQHAVSFSFSALTRFLCYTTSVYASKKSYIYFA